MTHLEAYLMSVRALRRLELETERARADVVSAERDLRAHTKAERRAGREPSDRPLPRCRIH